MTSGTNLLQINKRPSTFRIENQTTEALDMQIEQYI